MGFLRTLAGSTSYTPHDVKFRSYFKDVQFLRQMVSKVCIIGGKAAASNTQAKHIIRLITVVQHVVNNDPDVGDFSRCSSYLITMCHLQKLSSQLTICQNTFLQLARMPQVHQT